MRIRNLATDPSRQALLYARRNISPYVYLSSVDRESSTANIGILIQEGIIDHGEEGSTLRTVNLNNVGCFKWERTQRRSYRFVGPTRREFARHVRELYFSIIDRSQQLLLPYLYKRLVYVPEVNMAMIPLRKILIFLEKNGSVSPIDLGRRLAGGEGDRARRYFTVLEDLGFVKREKDKYVPGGEVAKLKAAEVQPPELYERILADVIEKRSKFLQEVLHLTMMVPFLRWSNAYYFPSYEAGHLVEMENEELVSNYRRFYQRKHEPMTEMNQIQRIVDIKVLSMKDTCFTGMPEIFNNYVTDADNAAILEPVMSLQ
ncbi:MAG: hypothetical protein NTX81_02040 [Candidatus Bathyarchaeota archaeon]|nr:hypothetical protein [Candidatus Bathyarchaeota archaeon]